MEQQKQNLNHLKSEGLKSIQSNLVLDGILLNPELWDSRENNINQGWDIGEKRGGRPYYPPQGWKEYRLRVVKNMIKEMIIGFLIMEGQENGV